MSKALRYVFAVFALALAPILLLQALANAQVPIGPARNWNGHFMALVSMTGIDAQQDGQSVSMNVSERGLRQARAAFAKEPTAGEALFVLAVEQRANGDDARLRSILDNASELDPRNRFIGALQLEQAAAQGDMERTFLVMDRLSAAHPSTRQSFMGPLVTSLGREEFRPLIVRELRKSPEWIADFWKSVPPDAANSANMYALRREMSVGVSEESDRRLLATLIATEQYSSAFDFWNDVLGGEGDENGFIARAEYPPFGWNPISTGNRSMTARGDEFDVYVQNDTSGELARQLVRLPPGDYGFAADIVPVSDAERVRASLQCVDAKEALGNPQRLDTTATWSVPAGCEFYWLILEATAWDMRQPLRVTISGMTFGAR